ncbi:MAG: ribosome silencing factor [Deltaproteobacteria bacterium]|nr:ribosome silencing factor [Deltaproteobacteria bacterium]
MSKAALEHKVSSPVLLDLSNLSSVADWFFIASAENSRQIRAAAEKIVQRAGEAGVKPLGQEGLGRGETHWALVDLGEVVAHIFNPETRALYDLEGLWADAPRG